MLSWQRTHGSRSTSDIFKTIEPLLQGLALGELDSDDVDFLVGDTGIERQHIEWLLRADSAEFDDASTTRSRAGNRAPESVPHVSDIPAAVFYGWFRLGLPTERKHSGTRRSTN